MREGSRFSTSSVGVLNADGGASDRLATTTAVDNAQHHPQPARVSPRPPSSSFPAIPTLKVQTGTQVGGGDALGSEPQHLEPQALASSITRVHAVGGDFSTGEQEKETNRSATLTGSDRRPWRETVEDASTITTRQNGDEFGQRGVEAEAAAAAGSAAFSTAEEDGGGEWCPVAARASACEAVPQLTQAFRSFDEKHPGATIM